MNIALGKTTLMAMLILTGSVADANSTTDLKRVKCVHHTHFNDNPDMSITFSERDGEDIVKTTISVLTHINNDHNWFTVFNTAYPDNSS